MAEAGGRAMPLQPPSFLGWALDVPRLPQASIGATQPWASLCCMWQGAAGAVLHSQSWQAWQDPALAAERLLAVQGCCGASTAWTRHRLWQSWLLYFKSLVQLSLIQHGLLISKRLLLFLLTARFCLACPLGAQQVCPGQRTARGNSRGHLLYFTGM